MGWKIPVLMAALLGALWICASADTEHDPRQSPPPGRALPPAPELKHGGTVTAPGPLAQELAEAELHPASAAGRTAAGGIQLPPLPPLAAKPAERQAAARRLAAAALALSREASVDHASAAPALSVPPGRLVKQSALWRKLQDAPLGGGPTAVLGSAMGSGAAGMLELSANFALPGETYPVAAALGNKSFDPFAAPVELVLPSPPPRMPLPNVRSSVTQISRGNPKLKRIALTFDDGPHPEYTSQLLAILTYYRIPATFMVVGVQAQKNPQWVKMIAQSGNEIANHSFDHFRMPALPLEEKTYQIDENQRLLEQLTGITPRFFRPPGGRCDDAIERMLCDRGMVLALWDVAVNDTAEDREAAELGKTAAKEIRSGSIVLMHDGIQATVDMLPGLIESMHAQGYDFVTLSELAAGV